MAIMSKLKNLFKSTPAVTPENSASDVANTTETRGLDAKHLAELKAEEAGAKWRAKAEQNGEIKKEYGGPKGLEPTRYGDWEKAGRCSDF